MTDAISENKQLSCLLIQAQNTDSFISNELTEVENNIDSCINSLGNDVFSGPIAEVARKGLNDYYEAIGNPIKVNFRNVSTELKNAYETLVEGDLSTKEEFEFIYDEQNGFRFKSNVSFGEVVWKDSKTGAYVCKHSATGEYLYVHEVNGKQVCAPVALNKVTGYSGASNYELSLASYGGTHLGVDIVAARGTPIYATYDGVIDYAGTDNAIGITQNSAGFGKMVTLNVDSGYNNGINQEVFAHLDSYVVKSGQTVKAGDIIGYMGATGNTPGGVHLHYQSVRGQVTNGNNRPPYSGVVVPTSKTVNLGIYSQRWNL